MIPMPETYLPYADIRRCGLQVTFEMVGGCCRNGRDRSE